MNILVIDDEESFVETTKDILEESEYTVFCAYTGSEAIRVIKNQSIDVALVDINLPDYEGIALIQDMKIIDPLLGTIIVTGYSSMDIAINSINVGADGYLSKPVDIKELLGIVKRLGVEITNEKLQRKMALNEKRLNSLHSTTIALSKIQSMDDIYDQVFKAITETLGYNIAGIAVAQGNGYKYVKVSEFLQNIVLDERIGLTGQVFETGESILIKNISEEPDYIAFSTDLKLKSELLVPIKFEDKVLAVINIESPQIGAFSEDDLHIVELLAEYVSSSVIRLWRLQELESLVSERTKELEESNQQLKQLDEMKNHFISTATHELRTPLASIKGYTELLLNGLSGPLDEEVVESLEIVYRNSERLKSLTDDLLDQQRLETGNFTVEVKTIDLNKLLDEIIKETSPFFTENSITFNVENDSLENIKADRIRLNQVLINLVNNAIRYSPKNSKITLKIEQLPNFIKFSVIDEGYGMSEDDVEKLFKPFPNIKSQKILGGTGLGLSICKGIIDLHGGEIWAESEGLEKGSKFFFTIPCE